MFPLARYSHCRNVSGRFWAVALSATSIPAPASAGAMGHPLISFPRSTLDSASNPFKSRSEDCDSHETLGPGQRGAACAFPRAPAVSLCSPCQGRSASTSSRGHTQRQVLQAPLSPTWRSILKDLLSGPVSIRSGFLSMKLFARLIVC